MLASAGVEYWIIDIDAEVLERWLPGDQCPEILSERVSWQRWPEHPPLNVDLGELFAEVHGRD